MSKTKYSFTLRTRKKHLYNREKYKSLFVLRYKKGNPAKDCHFINRSVIRKFCCRLAESCNGKHNIAAGLVYLHLMQMLPAYCLFYNSL